MYTDLNNANHIIAIYSDGQYSTNINKNIKV